jgi:hypothetical protein
MRRNLRAGTVLVAVALAVAISGGLSWATQGSGTTSNPIGRATFDGPFKVVRKAAGGWEVELEAKPGLDVATQTILFQPGGQSGWHSHPGPVLISVVSGTMTFYEAEDPDCTPIVRVAGQGYVDTGRHAHIARNETAEPAMNVVTYLVPPAAPLRLDEPDPGHCPF